MRALSRERLRRHLCAGSSLPIIRSRCDIANAHLGRRGGVGVSPGALVKADACLAAGRPQPGEQTGAVQSGARIIDPANSDFGRAYGFGRRRRDPKLHLIGVAERRAQ